MRKREWMLLPLLVAATAAGAQQSGKLNSRRSAVEAVQAQFALEIGMARLASGRRSTPDVTFDSLETPAPGITIWRCVLVGANPATPYLLALVDGNSEPIRLGGFPGPEIRELSIALGPLSGLAEAEDRARLLALSADPNGAGDLFWPRDRDTHAHAEVREWRQHVPPSWRVDTAVVIGQDRYYVRRTVVSRRNESYYVRTWAPLEYSFLFDKSGRLLAWEVRHGEPFGAR